MRVERRSAGSADDAAVFAASAEKPRNERRMMSRKEFGSESGVEFRALDHRAGDSGAAREAPRSGSEASEEESRDGDDARGPAAEALGELFSPLSAEAVPVDDANATPIPNAIDRALNWPM